MTGALPYHQLGTAARARTHALFARDGLRRGYRGSVRAFAWNTSQLRYPTTAKEIH
jgi:hypothetical protein